MTKISSKLKQTEFLVQLSPLLQQFNRAQDLKTTLEFHEKIQDLITKNKKFVKKKMSGWTGGSKEAKSFNRLLLKTEKEIQNTTRKRTEEKPLRFKKKKRTSYKPVGIKNQGNTCFLNALFQLIVNVPSLAKKIAQSQNWKVQIVASFLKKYSEAQNKEKNTVSIDTQLIRHLFNAGSSYSQQDIMTVINSLFESVDFGYSFTQYINGKKSRKIREERVIQLDLVRKLHAKQAIIFETLMDDFFQDIAVEDLKDHKRNLIQQIKYSLNSKFQKAPIDLIINLKRYGIFNGKHKKLNNKVILSEEYTLPKKFTEKHENVTYELQGGSLHSGELKAGHYFSIAKIEKQWYQISDSVCKSISKALALEILGRQGYILHYHRKRETFSSVQTKPKRPPSPKAHTTTPIQPPSATNHPLSIAINKTPKKRSCAEIALAMTKLPLFAAGFLFRKAVEYASMGCWRLFSYSTAKKID